MDATQHLNLTRNRIECELSRARNYIDLLVTKLEEAEAKELDDERERNRRFLEPHGTTSELALGCQSDSPDIPPLYTEFPRALAYSCTIFVGLIFDGEARVLCDAIANWKAVRPIRGIHKFREKIYAFLDKHLGRDTLGTIMKEDVEFIFSVRDCIAHAGGRVDLFSRPNDILAFATARPDLLSIDDYFRPGEMMLDLDSKYCTHALKVMENFFQEVFNTISKNGVEWKEVGPTTAAESVYGSSAKLRNRRGH